jgi:hypothetical protein
VDGGRWGKEGRRGLYLGLVWEGDGGLLGWLA